MRPDGRLVQFTNQGGSWVNESSGGDSLVELTDGSGVTTGWQYTTADNIVETYDAVGKLTAITNHADLNQTLSYDGSGNLRTVSDHFGRTLTFAYDTQNHLSTMTDPAGGTYTYSYDANDNLASVSYPDGKMRTYVYNEPANTLGADLPHSITGIIDENNNRFAVYGYDAQGRAISTEHAGGAQQATLAYNTDGSTTVTDALGTVRTYAFQTINGINKNTGISQPCAMCGGSAAQNITYDTNGNIASKTDFNGVVTTYGYDLIRNLETSRTEASGTPQARTITTQWHPKFRFPTLITEPGKTTAYTYDNTTGLLLKKTITDTMLNISRSWGYTYNAQNLLESVDGPRTDVNDVTAYAYDAQGNVTTITNALGQITQITGYDANGHPLTIVDPNGLTTTLTYAPRGWLTSRAVSDGTSTETTTYDYDGVGQLTKVTLPDNSYISYIYDAAHRLTGIADSLGNHVSYTLDAMGNRTAENIYDTSNTLTQTRSHVYNALNRLAQDIGAQNQTTDYSYDNNGNLTSTSDPLGHTTANSYDALNRLVQVTDPNSGITHYGYDDHDHVTFVTDPRNVQTNYSYDALDDLGQQVSPDTGTTTYTYDAAGNIKTKTDARGIVLTYSYDALNRVTSIATSLYSQLYASFEYDVGPHAIGKLDKVTFESGNIQYQYNSQGRLSAKIQRIGTMVQKELFTYDSTGRLTQATYPSGKEIGYTYDAQGRINTITLDGQTLLSNAHYSPFGEVTGWTWGNGSSYSRALDADGRIDAYTLNGLTRTLSYDAASRITDISDTTTQTFGYDNLDRLATYTTPTLSQAYGYDANGNRTALTIGTSNFTNTYSPTSNHLTNVSGPTVQNNSYDAAGNLIGNGDYTFNYDSAGRLVNAYTSGGTPVGIYKINALGQRVMKAVIGVGATFFFYDEAGRVINEYDNSGVTLQETIYLNNIPVAVLTTQETMVDNASANISLVGTWATGYIVGAQSYSYRSHAAGGGANSFQWQPVAATTGTYHVYARWAPGSNLASNAPYTIATASGNVTVTVDQQQNDGQWNLLGDYFFNAGQTAAITLTDNANGMVIADAVKIVPVDAATTYNIHTDQLNTPRAISDSTNKVVWRWDSDPFGTTAANDDPDLDGVKFTYNLRFPGQYYDGETGLHYNYFRDYDPETGRYVESDPIGLIGGFNTYSYVIDNPLGRFDLLGLLGYMPSQGPGMSIRDFFSNLPGADVNTVCWLTCRAEKTATCTSLGLAGMGIGGGIGAAIGDIPGAALGQRIGYYSATGLCALSVKLNCTKRCKNPQNPSCH